MSCLDLILFCFTVTEAQRWSFSPALQSSKTCPFQMPFSLIHLPSLCIYFRCFFCFVFWSETNSRGAPVLTLMQCSLQARVVRSESDGSFTLTLSVPELERAFGKTFKSKTKYRKVRRGLHSLQHVSAQPFLLQTLPGSSPDRQNLPLPALTLPLVVPSRYSCFPGFFSADELHLIFFFCFPFLIQKRCIRLFWASHCLARLTYSHRPNEGAPASFCPTSSILTALSPLFSFCLFSLCCHLWPELSFSSFYLTKGNTLMWFQLIVMTTMMMTFALFLPPLLLSPHPFTDNPFPLLTPPSILNYSKKEKAWGRAHLPQMSDECVATRDPHSSPPPPPPPALPIYRHAQSLTDDVPSHRFRFRYLRFGAILWTFFYFTGVFFFF